MDIKTNNNRYTFGDDGFKITNGTDYEERYILVSHDGVDSYTTIGMGNQITKHCIPIVLGTGDYFDLPSGTSGYGTVIFGDDWGHTQFYWASDGTVNLIDADSVVDSDTVDEFCIYDAGAFVRVKNNYYDTVRVMFEYNYISQPIAPTFQIFDRPSGVDNLDPVLTINGNEQEPIFRYKLGDADSVGLEPWGYGATLTRVAIGTEPTYNTGSPGLGLSDDSCKFNGSDYYKNATAVNQFTTGDIVVEVVWKSVDEAAYIFSTRNTNGLSLLTGTGGTGTVYLLLDDAGGNDLVVSANSGASGGTWNYAIIFVNRDEASTNGSQIYINGVASGTGVDLSAISGSLTSDNFCIGALQNDSAPSSSTVAYIAAWERASWHQAGAAGPAEWAVIAKERFAKFAGFHPQVFHKCTGIIVDGDMEAVGTTDWTAVDATLSKDTTAPLYEGTQHLRITSTGNTFYANQGCLLAGHRYRITGAARSDGTAIPRIIVGASGVAYWTGTTSTSWQEFDFEAEANGVNIFIGSGSNHPGVVDFDNVVVTQIDGLPNTATRAYAAYIDKLEDNYRKLYYVGSEWLRMCKRQDLNGENVYGYLPELTTENLITYSEDFTTTWTLNDPGDIITNDVVACPDGRIKGASIAADSSENGHGISYAPTLTADTYCYSVFIKPGTDATYGKSWVRLHNTLTGNYVFFDLGNMAIGTEYLATGYIEGPFYNNFYRCCLVFTGTAAVSPLRIYPADKNGDVIFAGDGVTPSLYVWGAQCELGDYMSSPIQTSGSALSRLKDQLRFRANENIGGEDVGQGSILADVLFPSYTHTVNPVLTCITKDAGAVERIKIYAFYDANSPHSISNSAAGSGGSTTVAAESTDNVKHTIGLLWEDDNFRSIHDGVLDDTPDTDVASPGELNTLDIGNNESLTQQMQGLIQNYRLYDIITTDG